MEEATMGFWPASWRTSPVKTLNGLEDRQLNHSFINPLLIPAKLLLVFNARSVSSTFFCLLNVETHKTQHQKNPFGTLRNLEGHQPRHRDIAKHSLEQFSPLAKLLGQ